MWYQDDIRSTKLTVPRLHGSVSVPRRSLSLSDATPLLWRQKQRIHWYPTRGMRQSDIDAIRVMTIVLFCKAVEDRQRLKGAAMLFAGGQGDRLTRRNTRTFTQERCLFCTVSALGVDVCMIACEGTSGIDIWKIKVRKKVIAPWSEIYWSMMELQEQMWRVWESE